MKPAAIAAAALLVTACASTPAPERAPAPARPVDAARLYSGVWREIGRLPMKITDGCVAGTTEYRLRPDGDVQVLDACRVGSPGGKLRTIGGRGEILDPGTNAKLRVRYRFMGVVPITWDYWILDRADDYSWFISADPTFDRLFIFTRAVVGDAERERLVARARTLGYDTGRLEFPPQPAG